MFGLLYQSPVQRGRGFPLPAKNPKLSVLRARVPTTLISALDEAANKVGMTRSGVIRDMLILSLATRGFWPPGKSEHSHE